MNDDELIEQMRDIQRQCGINEKEYADSYFQQFIDLFDKHRHQQCREAINNISFGELPLRKQDVITAIDGVFNP